MDVSEAQYLVTTAEAAALHLAQSRRQQLAQWDPASQLRLVINRQEPRASLGEREIEEMTGMPVAFTLPNA